MRIRTIHACPVEGIVKADENWTFRYDLITHYNSPDKIKMIVTNNGYMCEGVEVNIFQTTFEELKAEYIASELVLNGDINELFTEMPDEFIESMAAIYYNKRYPTPEVKLSHF